MTFKQFFLCVFIVQTKCKRVKKIPGFKMEENIPRKKTFDKNDTVNLVSLPPPLPPHIPTQIKGIGIYVSIVQLNMNKQKPHNT